MIGNERIAFLINHNTYFTVFLYFQFYKSYLGVFTFLVNPVHLYIFLCNFLRGFWYKNGVQCLFI